MTHDTEAHIIQNPADPTPIWRTENLESRVQRIEEARPWLMQERLQTLSEDVKDVHEEVGAVKKLLIGVLIAAVGSAFTIAFSVAALGGFH